MLFLKGLAQKQIIFYSETGSVNFLTRLVRQRWALSVFLNLFNNKKWLFCFFKIKLITYFFTSPIWKPTPSQINLIKSAMVIFYYWKSSKIPKVPSSVNNYTAEPQTPKMPSSVKKSRVESCVQEKNDQLVWKMQCQPQSWALSVFFNFLNKKIWFVCIFINKFNNLFLHQSYLQSPLPAKLTSIKKCKTSIFYCRKHYLKKKNPDLAVRVAAPELDVDGVLVVDDPPEAGHGGVQGLVLLHEAALLDALVFKAGD